VSPTPALSRSEVPAYPAFDAALADVLDAFARDRDVVAFEPMEIGEDLYPGLAFALNREAEGLNVSPPPAPPADEVASRPVPGFEPMEIGEDLYPGLAFALNREAEGLSLAGTPINVGSSGDAARGVELASEVPTTGARLSRAVRLTREAVFAWASLLHGPAVVTIAH
jgi:hypothetical protein